MAHTKPKRTTNGVLAVAGGAAAIIAGGLAYSAFVVPSELPLPHAVSGERRTIQGRAGGLSYYAAGQGKPLLLIHSVNAAASAYEVRPMYEHYAANRRVYALDLPGFGFSERGDRHYSPRLYADAILDMVEEIITTSGETTVDALALSLGSEFLARAASERPELFRTLALVSPTAFDKGERFYGAPNSIRGNPAVAHVLKNPVWSQALFNALNSRLSQRYFVERTFGSTNVDEGLLDYEYLSAHQPGAAYAPLSFVAGTLFSGDIDAVYDRLTMPVWLTHGVRGDFQNYGGVAKVMNRPNWSVQAFQTGALPHFEALDEFVTGYERFLQAT